LALVTGCHFPGRLAIDSTSLYWTDVSAGTVNQTPLNPAPGRVLAAMRMFPTGIAVDSARVFFTDQATVSQTALVGGPATVVAPLLNQGESLSIDAQDAYWLDLNDDALWTAPLAGGSPTSLASSPPTGVIGASGHSIALDDASVYWTGGRETEGASDGVVLKIAKGGGSAPTILVSAQNDPTCLAIANGSVFWVNAGFEGPIVSNVSLDGGPVTTLVPGSAGHSLGGTGLAVDDSNIYWTTSEVGLNNGTVNRAGLGGEAPTVLASGQPTPAFVVVDATDIYWANLGACETSDPNVGAIMKLAK
jgi:hypothetical protein